MHPFFVGSRGKVQDHEQTWKSYIAPFRFDDGWNVIGLWFQLWGSTLTGITITPIRPTIAVGATQLFTATGHFGNGPDQDLTHQANWSSSVPSVATIAGTGVEPSLATGVAQGTTQITVSFAQGSSNVQASTNLMVAP
jgi:hypothetical protein